MTNYTPPLPFVTWDSKTETHRASAVEDVAEMVAAYLECAVWADKPEGEDWGDAEFSQKSKDLAWFECCAFLRLAKWTIKGWTMEQLGYDFWLTRCGHGAGFWDRDFGDESSRDRLTALAQTFGETSVYRGDDGNLYLE